MKYLPFIESACVGVGVWAAIGAWSGAREPWDSGLYWTVGFPVMASCAFLIALFTPQKPWRWGGVIMLAQGVCGLAQAFPDINMWPLSLVVLFVLSLPLVAAAYVGSLVNRMLRRRADGPELREGLPVLREPAYAAEHSRPSRLRRLGARGEAKAASE